jgi:hypothetical protein
MAKNQRQPFTPRGPFIVARPFRWEGRDYKLNEDFEVSRMAISQRKLRTLWEAKSLDVKGDYFGEPEDVKTLDTKIKQDEKTELEAAEGEFLFDPAIHAPEKSGKEYWIADEENLLVRITSAASKRLKDLEEKTIVTAAEILEWPEADEPDQSSDDDSPDDDLDEEGDI